MAYLLLTLTSISPGHLTSREAWPWFKDWSPWILKIIKTAPSFFQLCISSYAHGGTWLYNKNKQPTVSFMLLTLKCSLLTMSNSLAPNRQKYTGKLGDACIASFLLPHGLTGLATKIRRAMLPSYMAVSEDLTALKTKKSRFDNNIAKAHQNFELPPTFPCGHGHHYSANLYQFSTAVELVNLSALSDALVCCHL